MALFAAFGISAPAAHATLGVPGDTPSAPITGTGVAGVSNALAVFEADIGGQDNGTVVGERGSGFRRLNWDGLAVDGSDGSSRTIEPGKAVALSSGRLEPWGIEQGPDVAVANDGFASANGNVAGDFPPFSHPNVWAPYNSNTAKFAVVAPAAAGSVPVPAQTRGLGIVFLNVTTTSDTTIQYYNGDVLLDQVSPLTNAGGPSFVGVVFPDAVVTRVVITLGTAKIFAFDGASPPTPTAPGPDFVAGDDVALGEPAPAIGTLAATAGVPVTAALDTFTESNSSATVSAVIDWGDGTHTPGTITPGAGGTLVVTGNHAYAQTGNYTAQVTVNDFGGPEQTKQTDIVVGPQATTTSITCSPTSVAVSASALCTATVAGATAPTGLVSFTSPTAGVTFAQDGGCLLGPTARPGVSACSVQFTPGRLPPAQARLVGAYGGDGGHASSFSETIIAVRPERCTVAPLSRRLRPGGLGLLVTCDARSGVQLDVKALVARKGPLRAFVLQFGTLQGQVTAGRPTVLVIKPARGVVPALRAALRRHQRVSLKLTLTASSRATRRTTTVSLPALRLR